MCGLQLSPQRSAELREGAVAPGSERSETLGRFQRWKTQDGERVPVERRLPVRPWWRTDDKGQVVFFVRLGWKAIEFEKGKAGVVAGSMEKLPEVIDVLIGAVRAGELDSIFEQATRSGVVDRATNGFLIAKKGLLLASSPSLGRNRPRRSEGDAARSLTKHGGNVFPAAILPKIKSCCRWATGRRSLLKDPSDPYSISSVPRLFSERRENGRYTVGSSRASNVPPALGRLEENHRRSISSLPSS